MDGSLHKVQSVTGRGPSRQGFRGPAEALLRLICQVWSAPVHRTGALFVVAGLSSSIFAPGKNLGAGGIYFRLEF